MHKITVHMTEGFLFDFFLYHTYSKFQGFMMNAFGLGLIVLGGISMANDKGNTLTNAAYLLVGIAFLVYMPIKLKLKARKAMKNEDTYKTPIEYSFSDESIICEQNGNMKTYTWDMMQRAVVAPKTIGIYLKNDEVLILPKQDFGQEFVPIFSLIAQKLGTNNVRMH